MTERRKFLRFETVLHALCDIAGLKTAARYKLKNISKEGALVMLDKRLGEGEEIRMTVDVPGDNVPIFATGQVAWQKEPSQGTSAFDTGVRFTKIDNMDKGRLLEYIYLQWLKLLEIK